MILVENHDFYLPHLHSMILLGGGSRWNISIKFGVEKQEWCGYPTVKNVQDVYFIRFDRIHKLCVKTVHQT